MYFCYFLYIFKLHFYFPLFRDFHNLDINTFIFSLYFPQIFYYVFSLSLTFSLLIYSSAISTLLFIWTILFFISAVILFLIFFTEFRCCDALLLLYIAIIISNSQSIFITLSLEFWSICSHNHVSGAYIISQLGPGTSSLSIYTLSLVISCYFMALSIILLWWLPNEYI